MENHSVKHIALTVIVCFLLPFGCTKPTVSDEARKNRKPPKEVKLTKAQKSGLLEGGELIFEDKFDRATLGKSWEIDTDKWKVKDKALHIQNAENAGCWLKRSLPEKVRVEFDIRTQSKDGDLKCEIFGKNADHESGYIVILGGWKNSTSIIARLDEHGSDRLETTKTVVTPGKNHHFSLVRTDDALHWFVDGKHVLTYDDAEPLRGKKFGFNNWATPAVIDNLKIYDLDR